MVFKSSLGAFAKLRKATISFIISVRRHGTARLPLGRFTLNLIVFIENISRKFKLN